MEGLARRLEDRGVRQSTLDARTIKLSRSAFTSVDEVSQLEWRPSYGRHIFRGNQ